MKTTATQRRLARRLAVEFIENVKAGRRNKFTDFANDWATRQVEVENMTDRQWAKVCKLSKIDIMEIASERGSQ